MAKGAQQGCRGESREGLEDDDYTVRVEKEDRFRLDGARATVGGQPDLVVKKDIDVTFIDVKTGTPRQWDIIHVMLYMCGLGRYVTAWGDITLKGRVIYSDHVVDIPAYAISPEFIEQLGSLIRRWLMRRLRCWRRVALSVAFAP